MPTTANTAGGSPATPWLSWLLGTAVLGAVVAAALHVSDHRAFVEVAERAQPRWLVAATLLQAGTYLAQGWIWRLVGAAANCRLSRKAALELAFAKLFTDQALPSAGLSSSIFIAKALEQRQLPTSAVRAAVLVNIASYHFAYVAALVAALAMLQGRGNANAFVIGTALLFLLFSLGLSVAVLALSGQRHVWATGRWQKIPGLSAILDFLSGADVRLVRNPRVLAEAIGLQSGCGESARHVVLPGKIFFVGEGPQQADDRAQTQARAGEPHEQLLALRLEAVKRGQVQVCPLHPGSFAAGNRPDHAVSETQERQNGAEHDEIGLIQLELSAPETKDCQEQTEPN